jgi:ABC-type methionine transport system ATPase subunit
MAKQVYQFIYPPTLLRRPVLNQLIRQYQITANILEANITLEEGWLQVELSGEPDEIERALGWLTAQGIEVREVG